MKDKELISVVVPCYNEQEVLPLFYKEITKISGKMQNDHPELEFEYLFIDDGSKDRTLRTLRVMAKYDKRVRYISFSRNFGKEAGIYAGLSNAKGDYCVVMDADLQHPPAFLPQMYEAVASGHYDCATTRRVSREGESKVRSWFARLFYKIMNKISQTEIVDGAQDFRFMTRQMVDAVLSMSEYNRFSKGIFSWVGFRVKYIEYENVERAAGTSAWSFWGLFRYSLEGIIGFSTFPLSFSAILGIISCALGAIMLIVTIIKKLAVGEPVAGYPTLICTLLFFGGLQLFCTGILGLYLGKTYLEVKKRPIYLARETEADAERMLELPDAPAEPEKPAAEDAEDEADEDALPARKAGRKEDVLENAARLKKETDEEFDAIVDAAFADDAGDEDADAALTESDDEDAAEDDGDQSAAEDSEDEAADAAEESAETAAEKPKKPKFEVKIDYDSIDFDEDFDDDDDRSDDADDDEYEDDDFDGEEEYDDDFDDDFEDDDEYEDADEPLRKKGSAAAPLTENGGLAGLWETVKEKCAALWEKLKADRTGIPELDDPDYSDPDDGFDDFDGGDYDDIDEDFDDMEYDDADDFDDDDAEDAADDADTDDEDDDDSSYRGAHF